MGTTTWLGQSSTSGPRISLTARASSRSASSGSSTRASRSLRTADANLYRLNLLVLLFASFLPFPTKVVVEEFVGDWHPHPSAVVFYGLTLLALDLAMLAFFATGRSIDSKNAIAEE